MSSPSVISVEYRRRVAVITIDNQAKLNALNQAQYYELAQKMNEVAARDDVFITVLIGKGRFFSAGADVTVARPASSGGSAQGTHHQFLTTFVANNLHLSRTFYTHPKILVSALNGPAIGLSAAITALSDFIYCVPSTFLLTPFSSLGLVTEGASSKALVRRLGPAKANEALIMSKRITAKELKETGYVNEIFDVGKGPGEDERFRERVLKEVNERLGDHLNGESLIGIKKLVRPDEADMDKANVAEVFAGLERFMKGVPQEEFRKIASGEKRHKL